MSLMMGTLFASLLGYGAYRASNNPKDCVFLLGEQTHVRTHGRDFTIKHWLVERTCIYCRRFFRGGGRGIAEVPRINGGEEAILCKHMACPIFKEGQDYSKVAQPMHTLRKLMKLELF